MGGGGSSMGGGGSSMGGGGSSMGGGGSSMGGGGSSMGGGGSSMGGGSGLSNSKDCWQNGHSNVFAISSSAMRTASLQDGQLISISLGIRKRENYSHDSGAQPKTGRFSSLPVSAHSTSFRADS